MKYCLKIATVLFASACCLWGASSLATAQEFQNGIRWEKPAIVTPGATDNAPPSDAVVLFDGTSLDLWHGGENWNIVEGTAVIGKDQITSKQEFGDCQLHIEWSAPTPPKGNGQGRGNSGLFLMGRYELQILDSYDNETYHDGQAGAIYKQTPPAVNAIRPPGEWNHYDVFWTAPKFNDAGELVSPAYITAVVNGVLVLNHFELLGDTPYSRPPAYSAHAPTGPISLQDHGDPVRFRNIWVREFKPAQGVAEREPFLRDGETETPIAQP